MINLATRKEVMEATPRELAEALLERMESGVLVTPAEPNHWIVPLLEEVRSAATAAASIAAFQELAQRIWATNRTYVWTRSLPNFVRSRLRIALPMPFCEAMLDAMGEDLRATLGPLLWREVFYGTAVTGTHLWIPLHQIYQWATDSEVTTSGRVEVANDDYSFLRPAGGVDESWRQWMTWVNEGVPLINGWTVTPWFWSAIPAIGLRRGGVRVERVVEQVNRREFIDVGKWGFHDRIPAVGPSRQIDPTWEGFMLPVDSSAVATAAEQWKQFLDRGEFIQLVERSVCRDLADRHALLESAYPGAPVSEQMAGFIRHALVAYTHLDQPEEGMPAVDHARLPWVPGDLVPAVLTRLSLLPRQPRMEKPTMLPPMTFADLQNRGWRSFLDDHFPSRLIEGVWEVRIG